MVRRVAELGPTGLLADTASCVHFPLRSKGPKQCGLCPSCLGTYQAMAVAGVGFPADTYRDDVLKPTCNDISADGLSFLRAQILQVSDLHRLTPNGMKPEILRRHLVSSHAITISDTAERWVDLLGRSRDEWLKMIAMGRENGCHWPSWIDGCEPERRDENRGGIDNERHEQIRPEELQRAACSVS